MNRPKTGTDDRRFNSKIVVKNLSLPDFHNVVKVNWVERRF